MNVRKSEKGEQIGIEIRVLIRIRNKRNKMTSK